jgi:glycosyltransferase involved in cell wall biosynthesis/ribosomal protein S18 acetylase RimI-like enzyme
VAAPVSISVVVPVFNGAKTLPTLVERCHASLVECASSYEVILVNDGSGDDSWARIEELASRDPAVRGIDLARNYGQHNALLAGIREARCEVVVTLDDDLQNPPHEIPILLAALMPDVDVVYGQPIAKRQGIPRRIATQLVVRALHLLGAKTATKVSSFRAFRTELREAFAEYASPDVSVDGLLTWRTDRFVSVRVQHDTRAHGESNYSLLKLIRHSLTMITAFSTRPLRIASGIGFLVILFGIFVLGYVLVRFILEGGSVPGFPFLASIISIFSGAQLFAVGVIGEYLARAYVQIMSKPSYTVRAQVGGEGGPITAEYEVARGRSDGFAETDPPCRMLEWDSEFWGFRVARVAAHRLNGDTARRVATWSDGAGVRCTFLLAAADDRVTDEAAQAVGFWPVDTRVTLQREPGPPSGNNRRQAVQIRPAVETDRDVVVALAASAHSDTRFFFDTGFPDGRAGVLYERWVCRGLDEADRQLLVAEEEGEILGYLLTTASPPSIDLIAVADRARRKGVGAALVDAAVEHSPTSPFEVVTQARNVAALRLYESAGFRVAKAEVWYHRWS